MSSHHNIKSSSNEKDSVNIQIVKIQIEDMYSMDTGNTISCRFELASYIRIYVAEIKHVFRIVHKVYIERFWILVVINES